jgi:hypothetical protein
LLGSLEVQPEDVKKVDTLVPFLRRLDALPAPFGQHVVMVLEKA